MSYCSCSDLCFIDSRQKKSIRVWIVKIFSLYITYLVLHRLVGPVQTIKKIRGNIDLESWNVLASAEEFIVWLRYSYGM